MAAVLGTNIASIWASKNLQSAQGAMASSVERLSSGHRINRAKDDAAGLGIANALTQQINGANQGVRNLNDGISMLQTAEGAINAASEMAQRILTLSTQGANGSMSQDGRTAIQNELKGLLNSISSISTRTSFAGTSLLNVADGAVASTTKTSIYASSATSDTVALTNSAFYNIGASFATATNTGNASATSLTLSTAASASVVNGGTIWKMDGSGAYVALGTLHASTAVSSDRLTITLAAGTAWTTGDVIVFDKGMLSKNSTNASKSLVEAVYSSSLVSSTAATAQTAFENTSKAATDYLTLLTKQRSELGAYQNQLDYAVNNVTELSANLTSARSRVQDTDYASETASLTKGQILQQAATAMLAQANQMPNVILSLLK
jgi:flagellin